MNDETLPDMIALGDPAKLAQEVAEIRTRRPSLGATSPAPLADLPATIDRMRQSHPPMTPEQEAEWEWRNTILPHLEASRLPLRFHRDIKKWPEIRQHRVFQTCLSLFQRTGAIVALVGPRGVGKTTIAAQLTIARARDSRLLPWERRPPYRKMSDLIAAYKPLYADFGSIHSDFLALKRDWFCANHPLVTIDELHECDDQKMKDRVLTDILDRRYSNLTDTLLISNQSPEEFMATTNDSILSRLSEHGRVISCNWNSFRTPQTTEGTQ